MNQRKVFFDNIKNDLKDRGRDYVKAQNRRHWRASWRRWWNFMVHKRLGISWLN